MKPILFNTEMVRAILDGRKTVTRRIAKPLREEGISAFYAPFCVGDILYVRETCSFWPCFACGQDMDGGSCKSLHSKHFRKHKGLMEYGCYHYKADYDASPYEKWTPSIHMPKEAARIFLKVTNVHVEPLQKITENQAKKEGFVNDAENCVGNSARRHFKELWDTTIEKDQLQRYGWYANPYVWVIEFERCEKPEESPCHSNEEETIMNIVKKDGYRILKLHFSMQGEYEVIQTNAPNTLIMAQLVYTNERELAGEEVRSNYDIIEAMGFEVEVIGSHNDKRMDAFDWDLVDEHFDYYDYYVSPEYR